MREGRTLNGNGQGYVPGSYGQEPEQERQPRGRHAAPERTRRGRHAAPAPPDGDVPVEEGSAVLEAPRSVPPAAPGSTSPYPSAPGGLTPEPLAGPAEAGRSVAPAPGAQGPSGHGGASGASYGIMPGSGDAHTDHSSGPTAAPGYGRVAPPGGVPAGAVPPAPAAVPASSGQYGLMPAQATATRSAQSVAGPVMLATAGPVPVAACQASEAVSVSSSTVRPVGLSVSLGGASVRLEWWEHLGGFLMRFRALRVLMRVRMVLTWVSLLVVGVALAVSPVARAVLGPGSVACGSWRSASGWRGARPSPGA